MSWYDEMLDSMSKYVSECINRSVTVTSYEDRTKYGGYCETCSFEYVVVDLTYVDEDGKVGAWTYDGSMNDLMYQLRK